MNDDTVSEITSKEIDAIDAYWRACNYLAAGMIQLRDNPLLREPLAQEHIKARLLSHWGSSPGLAFVYVHMNRLIVKHDLGPLQAPTCIGKDSGPSPVCCGSACLSSKDDWRLGAIFGLPCPAELLRVGLPWLARIR